MLARQGITDTFIVEAGDAATGFHIHGLLGLIITGSNGGLYLAGPTTVAVCGGPVPL